MPLGRAPKPARTWKNAGSRDQDRTIGVIQDAESEVAHDVVTEDPARLRGASHDQIGVTLADFGENLIDHDSMPDMHFRRHAYFFEILFLGAKIDSKFRIGFKQMGDVFFESHQIGINRRRFGHDVEQGRRRADSGG